MTGRCGPAPASAPQVNCPVAESHNNFDEEREHEVRPAPVNLFVMFNVVEVAKVKIPVEAEVAPIAVLLIVPPEIVKASATLLSANVPTKKGEKVCVLPLEIIFRPKFVSVEVARV